jgi:hypothetical protein
MIGPDGWLLDTWDIDSLPGPQNALDSLVQELRETALQCRELGVSYLVAIAPTKAIAVPGAVPRGVEPRRTSEELLVRLEDVDEVSVVDLRHALGAAARRGAPFNRTDPDWSAIATFYVARALVREARKLEGSISPLDRRELPLREVTGHRGSLTELPIVAAVGGDFVQCEVTPPDETILEIDPRAFTANEVSPDERLAGVAEDVQVMHRSDDEGGARVALVGGENARLVARWVAECATDTVAFADPRPAIEAVEIARPQVLIHIVDEQRILDAGEVLSAGGSNGAATLVSPRAV